MTLPRTDNRLPAIQAEDDQALAIAESQGFMIRRTMQHRAHRIYARRCRERGIPCICVYIRRDVADVTLEMPGGPSGWQLSPEAQEAATDLIRAIGCAAYNVGPTRVVSCRMPVDRAPQLARFLSNLAQGDRPDGDRESSVSAG